jgi:hypothetical protein
MVDGNRRVSALRAGPETGLDDVRRPAVTERWLRDVAFTSRLAFEREMKRERRRRLDSRLALFLKRTSARQA